MTVIYGKVHDKHTADMEVQQYTGTILPHPDMMTSHADLAVIQLESPIEDGASPVSLANSEVMAGEHLTMAGYGHDQNIEQAFGERYFRRNRVSQSPPPSERFAYSRLSVDIHTNHGGWPCLRENEKGQWLVGISSSASDEDLSCVSTHFYGEWLRSRMGSSYSSVKGPMERKHTLWTETVEGPVLPKGRMDSGLLVSPAGP